MPCIVYGLYFLPVYLITYVHSLAMLCLKFREICHMNSYILACYMWWMMHICISELTIIGSDNGFLPDGCQVIIWTSMGLLLFVLLGTNFSANMIQICTFSFKKMYLKILSRKWRPICVSLNLLIHNPFSVVNNVFWKGQVGIITL